MVRLRQVVRSGVPVLVLVFALAPPVVLAAVSEGVRVGVRVRVAMVRSPKDQVRERELERERVPVQIP